MADDQKVTPLPIADDEPQQPESDTADQLPTEGKKPRRSGQRKKPDGTTKPRPRPSSSTRSRRGKKVDIAKGMAELYTVTGMGLSMVPTQKNIGGVSANFAVGTSIVEQSAAIGDAWAKAADENPAIRDALEKVLAVSVVGTLVSAHMPIVMAAVVAYGMVPPSMAAMFTPAPAPEQAQQQQQAAA